MQEPLPHLPRDLKKKKWLVLTLSPKPETAFKSSPTPKGSSQACVCSDIQCGGLNRELVSGSGAPPFILPAPSPQERPTLETRAKDRA